MIPDPNIYKQDAGQISNDLLPVKKRLPIHLAWLKALLSACQWDHDLIFKYYADGYVGLLPVWTSGNPYVYLDRVIHIDGAVYELENTAGLASSTLAPNIDTDNWIKILDSFIGARERARYTGQKLMLEYALNRRFFVASYSVTEWEIQWISGVPVPQSAPPFSQIYIKSANNVQTNFWLSNGGAGSLTSYMSDSGSFQGNFLGNGYNTYSPFQFTIYVPTALYAQIQSYQPPGVTAEQAIRSVADPLLPAGSFYEITQY